MNNALFQLLLYLWGEIGQMGPFIKEKKSGVRAVGL